MAKPWQVKRIHVLCANLGFDTRKGSADREMYEEMLAQYNGKTTSLKLTYEEANDLISKLTDLAVDMGVWKRRPKPAPEYASPKQKAMIRGMWDEISYVRPSERRAALDRFLQKRFGTNLNHLYRNQVGKVVKTLEAMKR